MKGKKNMKAEVTRYFAKTLNNNARIWNAGITLHYTELTEQQYLILVGYNSYKDIDTKKNGKIATIRIEYNPDLYAVDQYISTEDIRKCAISANSYTLQDFITEFIERYGV